VETEELREALVNLQRDLDAEQARRIEAQVLLDGALLLTKSTSIELLQADLIRALARVIDFRDAFVLRQRRGSLVCMYSTWSDMIGIELPKRGLFERVLGGETIASFDIGDVPAWESQAAKLRSRVVSAIHAPISSSVTPGSESFEPVHVGSWRRTTASRSPVRVSMGLLREGSGEVMGHSP